MDYTTNYQLPVWAETDRILMEDFNGMTSALEAALNEVRDDVDANTADLSANTAAHAHFGNCQLYTLSYVGTGVNSGPRTFTFPHKPCLLVIFDPVSCETFLLPSGAVGVYGSTGNSPGRISWSGNAVTVTYEENSISINVQGKTYHIFALLELA